MMVLILTRITKKYILKQLWCNQNYISDHERLGFLLLMIRYEWCKLEHATTIPSMPLLL